MTGKCFLCGQETELTHVRDELCEWEDDLEEEGILSEGEGGVCAACKRAIINVHKAMWEKEGVARC